MSFSPNMKMSFVHNAYFACGERIEKVNWVSLVVFQHFVSLKWNLWIKSSWPKINHPQLGSTIHRFCLMWLDHEIKIFLFMSSNLIWVFVYKTLSKIGLHLPLEKEIINDFWKFLPFSFIKQMNPADCSLTRDRYYFYRWWVLGNEYRTKCFTENENSNGSWILCPITLVIGSFQVLSLDT